MGKRAQRKRAERERRRIRLLPDMRSVEGVTASIATGLEGRERTSLDAAQNLVYEAFDSQGPKRVELARRALAITQDCADAYGILAEEAARSLEEKRDLFAAGVAAGERTLGRESFERDAGSFWGLIETRPYMRVRAGLANCLWQLGERDEAVGHYRDLLRLNPGDNQGIRYTLLSCLMTLGRDAEAQRLADSPEYADDASATWAYAGALLAFRREGAGQLARKLLAEAQEINRFAPAYLTGQKPLPKRIPELIGFGDASEAVACAAEQSEAWDVTPRALEWLRAEASPARGQARAPTRRVRVTSGSRRGIDDGRRRWLFPPVSGSFDDIELADLDPARPEERHFLIAAEHADFDRAIKQGHDEVEVAGSLVNPRLHITMHEVVANQLWDGNPGGVWPTVERLRRAGYERHDILHMLASVVTEQMWKTLHEGQVHDPEECAMALAALPKSWVTKG